MRMDRFYLTVIREATASLTRKIRREIRTRWEIRRDPRQIPDCFGDYAPNRDLRASEVVQNVSTFIYSFGELLIAIAHSLALSFLSFSFWPFFWPSSSAARERAFNALVEDDHPRYRIWECSCSEHQTISVHWQNCSFKKSFKYEHLWETSVIINFR